MKTIDTYGRQLWVLGSPIEHTLSPPIHNAAFEAAGLPHRYFALEVESEELEDFLSMFTRLEALGANFTLPLKESIREFVEDETEAVKKTGAANTLYWSEADRLALDNTDVYGFKQLVEPWWETLNRGSVLLLGAGGAARACLLGLDELGVDEVYLWNRTTEKAETLAERYSDMTITVLSDDELQTGHVPVSVVVNSTSLGLKEGDPSPVPEDRITPEMVGVDLIYGRQTQFQRDFDEHGSDSVDGLTMLVQQAARAWGRWTGQDPDLDAMETAVVDEGVST